MRLQRKYLMSRVCMCSGSKAYYEAETNRIIAPHQNVGHAICGIVAFQIEIYDRSHTFVTYPLSFNHFTPAHTVIVSLLVVVYTFLQVNISTGMR